MNSSTTSLELFCVNFSQVPPAWRIEPGATELTVTPSLATAMLVCLDAAIIAALAAMYGAVPPYSRPNIDEMLMARPQPRSCMPGTTYFIRATADQRLAFMTMWKSSSEELTRSDVPRLPPTLFTRMSIGPSSASALPTRSAAPLSSPRSATYAPTFTPIAFSSLAV